MRHLSKILTSCALAGLTACATPEHLQNAGAPAPGGATPAGNTTAGVVPGSASDPASPLYFQQTVGDRVLFPVDQSSLTEQAVLTLQGQARWLLEHPEYDVIIEGHADEQGTREYNLALGARRATSVHTYLLSQGVPAGRMRTVSYGKEKPIEVCSTEACYNKNRRAVTVISGGSMS